MGNSLNQEPRRAGQGLGRKLLGRYRRDRLPRAASLPGIDWTGGGGQRIYTLADGSEITMDITGARIEFMRELVWATIVMADAGADPLLGLTALESAGVGVEPLNETLRKLPSTGLRGLGNSGR